VEDLAQHYDKVSKAWQIIMGERQHFGLYNNNQDSIDRASLNLVEGLLALSPPENNSSILDLGCGCGGTTFYLQKKYRAQVTGIGLGKEEIEIANNLCAEKKLNNKINFLQGDGQNNKLKSEQFNTVLMLESSVLIPDKKSLFEENFRVLKKGGTMLICDPFKLKRLSASEMYKQGRHFETLQKSFGKSYTETLENYQSLLLDAGFSNIETKDISKAVSTSPRNWKSNALANEVEIKKHFSDEQYQNFLEACEVLHKLFENKVLGYIFIKAEKPVV
jgi:ubiquinone/menaquinone biosynthesis C-methylase UbiE